ncbi:MAG: family efflux transporter, subunit [Alphaproteobacteria bacterium]|nr:family efflux transporter, subunit [Alphaproteobacteria bacterium]
MRNKKAVLAAAAAALLLAGCSSRNDDSYDAQAPAGNVKLTDAQRRHIRIYTIVPSTFSRTVVAPGTVDFDNDQATAVVSPFTGPVTRLLVSIGQHVAKGQPLALVQSGDYAAAVGAYRKALAAAANARKLAAVDRDLAAHDGISQREAAQAQVDAAGAAADRDAALQALTAMNGGVPGARIARDGGAIIRAPIAGTIVDRPATPGQLLQAGTTPLFTVANLSRVWVLAQVASSDVVAIAPHDPAEVDAGAGIGSFHGIVDNISASVDPNSRAVIARIVLANPGALLKRQMYVDVSIKSARAMTGLMVPVSAVLRDDQNLPFVYLALPDGRFARRHVTLGYRDGDRYDATEGLAAGDRVVVDGAIFLQFMQNQ